MDIEKIAIIVIFSIGLASVSAAQQQELQNQTEVPQNISDIAVPGDSFYALKKMRESISLAMARAPVIGGPDKEARMLSKIADERLKEAEVLFERNDADGAEKALQRYSKNIDLAQKKAETLSDNKTRDVLSERARKNQEVLQRISEKAPEKSLQGIEKAMESSSKAKNSLGVPKGISSDNPFVPPGERDKEEDSNTDLDGSDSPFEPPNSGEETESSGGGS